jgi:hypothetical protein
MEIIFDGHKMREVSAETPTFSPRISAITLLNGDTHIQTEEGKFGVSLAFSGVVEDWSDIVAISAKLGFKGTLISPEYTFSNCAISSFSSSKVRGSGSKYKYEISFVKEGGGL